MSNWVRLLATVVAVGLLAHGAAVAAGKKLGLGREALPEEIAAWDTDVQADGRGLPPGRGTVKQGEEIYVQRCASCHGEFGQGAGRWPALAGGKGSLKADRPSKTIGSFWPQLAPLWDYTRRTMPWGNARSLSADETYAVVAFLLNLNDIVGDDFELNDKNLASIKMPNAAGFIADDRESSERKFWNRNPCIKDCRGVPKITSRAGDANVTPDAKSAPKVD
ncbi:MAG TPA: cytochrome c [Bradyrhizobium sp.]|nr:cytochrome c [Bradyrhizobium sp.]